MQSTNRREPEQTDKVRRSVKSRDKPEISWGSLNLVLKNND